MLFYICCMKNSFEILQELIAWLDAFEKNTTDKANLKDFVLWLNSELFGRTKESMKNNNQQNNMFDMELTHLLIMQNKHFKSYSKQALKNSKISTTDDFSFLFHLSVTESYRKMEIINLHQLEAPSGIEVLKRLLKAEFIEEFSDADDRRAKRIKITKKGREELAKSMINMQKVFEVMPANFDINQKIILVSLLLKMNEFHVNNVNNICYND